MSNIESQHLTIDLDSLATVTGGAGGENGGPASERPRKGLNPLQKALLFAGGLASLVGGTYGDGLAHNVTPERTKLSSAKPPWTISQTYTPSPLPPLVS